MIQLLVLLIYLPTVLIVVDQFCKILDAQLLVLLVNRALDEIVFVEKKVFAKVMATVPPEPPPPVTPPPAPPAPCVFTTVPVRRAT